MRIPNVGELDFPNVSRMGEQKHSRTPPGCYRAAGFLEDGIRDSAELKEHLPMWSLTGPSRARSTNSIITSCLVRLSLLFVAEQKKLRGSCRLRPAACLSGTNLFSQAFQQSMTANRCSVLCLAMTLISLVPDELLRCAIHSKTE